MSNAIFDIHVMIVFGVVGYLMWKSARQARGPMRQLMLLGVLATLTTRTAHADVWYLNGSGPGTSPQIWAFGDDGLPLSADPVAAVSARLGAIAWPSAIRVGSVIRLYASAYSGGRNTVRLWRSEDG